MGDVEVRIAIALMETDCIVMFKVKIGELQRTTFAVLIKQRSQCFYIICTVVWEIFGVTMFSYAHYYSTSSIFHTVPGVCPFV